MSVVTTTELTRRFGSVIALDRLTVELSRRWGHRPGRAERVREVHADPDPAWD